MNLHEDLGRKQEGRGSSDRGFGIVFAVFFALVALGPLRRQESPRWWALALGVVFLAIAWVRAGWLRPMNRVWTRLGLLLGQIVNPLVTGLLFYVVVTPMALLLRAMGKDPLRLTTDPEAQSYWINRHPPGPPPETMPNQF